MTRRPRELQIIDINAALNFLGQLQSTGQVDLRELRRLLSPGPITETVERAIRDRRGRLKRVTKTTHTFFSSETPYPVDTFGLNLQARIDYAPLQKRFPVPREICTALLGLDYRNVLNQALMTKVLLSFLRLKRDGYVRTLNTVVMWVCGCCRRTVARACKLIIDRGWFFRRETPIMINRSGFDRFKVLCAHGEAWILSPRFHRTLKWLNAWALRLSYIDLWKISIRYIKVRSYVSKRASHFRRFAEYGRRPSKVEVINRTKGTFNVWFKWGYREIFNWIPGKWISTRDSASWL